MRTNLILIAVFVFLFAETTHGQNKRDLAVRADRTEFAENDAWIYDDLETALQVATDSNRPLMIVFR